LGGGQGDKVAQKKSKEPPQVTSIPKKAISELDPGKTEVKRNSSYCCGEVASQKKNDGRLVNIIKKNTVAPRKEKGKGDSTLINCKKY